MQVFTRCVNSAKEVDAVISFWFVVHANDLILACCCFVVTILSGVFVSLCLRLFVFTEVFIFDVPGPPLDVH